MRLLQESSRFRAREALQQLEKKRSRLERKVVSRERWHRASCKKETYHISQDRPGIYRETSIPIVLSANTW